MMFTESESECVLELSFFKLSSSGKDEADKKSAVCAMTMNPTH